MGADGMLEPKVVVANREDLWWLLTEASQLEHMIMCQYLFAEFSLKNGTYRMGNFVPWRPSAWALLHERTSALAAMCANASEHDGAPGAIGDAGDRTVAITAALAAGAGSRQ